DLLVSDPGLVQDEHLIAPRVQVNRHTASRRVDQHHPVCLISGLECFDRLVPLSTGDCTRYLEGCNPDVIQPALNYINHLRELTCDDVLVAKTRLREELGLGITSHTPHCESLNDPVNLRAVT